MALFLNLDEKARSCKTNHKAHPSSDSPKSTVKDLYEYGDGVPDVANKNKQDNIYGNRDGSVHDYDGTRIPRRSSLKGSNRTGGSRRASIHGCLTRINVEIHVPGKGTQYVQRRRTIDFNRDVGVVEVPRIPSEDRARVWLQHSDFIRIKQDIRDMKSRILSGDIMPWEEEETRGLEKIVDGINGSRKKAACRSKDAVFDEQDIQDSINDYNEQRIADAYKMCTTTMQRHANSVARQDALEARSYLHSPRTQKLLLKSMRRLSC